jgi:DNA polymerase III epsilon subunit-like protein
MDTKKIYCSLDIETTGFDPLKEEILEVGFAFFEISDKGLRITEEWTQVFKPSKEVSAQIIGLTGISKAEMESAPTFAEHRDFIQEKLGNAIIVGHNIAFDIKFLEGFGIKFSGVSIDTLDLVQWLLPTHHSYNLENLMHTFSISHKDAHRALADSKATLKLLEKLLSVFCSLPTELKEKIKKFIKPNNFLWAEFLEYNLKPLSFIDAGKKTTKLQFELKQKPKLELEDKNFYNFSLAENYVEQVVRASTDQKTLLVVPKVQIALDLQKNKLADATIVLPEQMFDVKKFNALIKKKNLPADTVRFLLKILVWQETNWQTQTILDLNLSFFGGQFKTLVSGGKIQENKSAKIIACDMAAFLSLQGSDLFIKRKVVICGLNEFETAVTSNISTKASWGYMSFLLKSFYNPEFPNGTLKFKEPVTRLLLATDLFFGLVSALLKNEGESFQYFKITPDLQNNERWNKVQAAADNFSEKLNEENKLLESQEISRFRDTLKLFFETEDNRVKWIELAENRCVFSSMPVDISGLVQKSISRFEKVSVADALDFEILPKFFLNRLGLSNFKITQADNAKSAKSYKQGDLFSGIKNILGKNNKITFHYQDSAATEQDLLTILKNKNPWPAAILFASPVQVKEFYEHNYETLKQEVSLIAQTAYGGSNKILRNFAINKNSLMLVADKFLLKAIVDSSAVEQVTKVAVKTLVICRLPFEQFTHPYQEAVSATLANAFEDYALPKALYNLHSLIKLFYTPELSEVYMIDAKLTKPYAKVFKNYHQIIPNAVLK